jgi:hypothetical protein
MYDVAPSPPSPMQIVTKHDQLETPFYSFSLRLPASLF